MAAHGARRSLQAAVDAARRDPTCVVLEGVHALKHAVRFGATIDRIGSPTPSEATGLLADLAPDVVLPVPLEQLDDSGWSAMTGGGLPSPVIAVARRPAAGVDRAVATGTRPVVVLEEPTHLGNVGAVVRVAAAADADGVVVVGEADPWHPRAVRGAAGLQFALPVGQRPELDALGPTDRPVVALDPAGEPLVGHTLPADALVLFGTERRGLSDAAVARADAVVRLPMRAGVSSLNLATAVAAVLYGGIAGDAP